MTPNSALRSIPQCNGEFSYDKQKAGRIKLWIRYSESAPTDREGKPSNNSERTYPQWVYDFDNEERAEDDLTDEEADNFSITTSSSSPNENQYVDVVVRARD